MPDVKHFDPESALERAGRLFWRRGSADTSIQAISEVTGLNRSSLYATFGDKDRLYRRALRQYLDQRCRPVADTLRADERGLPAIREFFDALIRIRCGGEFAGWGCMMVNAQAGTEHLDADVQSIIDEHHEQFCRALAHVLGVARGLGQTDASLDCEASAELLALLAYGVNLRSRAGAAPQDLRRSVDAGLVAIAGAVDAGRAGA